MDVLMILLGIFVSIVLVGGAIYLAARPYFRKTYFKGRLPEATGSAPPNDYAS